MMPDSLETRLPKWRAGADAAQDALARFWHGHLEARYARAWLALFGLYLKVFPRPRLDDPDKNRVTTVVADFFAIEIIYYGASFVWHLRSMTAAGVEAYTLYLITLLLIRHHAVKGRLAFSAILFFASAVYFYMAQTIDFGYFEHLQATNFLVVVGFSTIVLGPLAGAIVLAASLTLFQVLYQMSLAGLLVPLSTLLPNIASPLGQELQMITVNLVEFYIFCWLVRAHLYSQLTTSLRREKEEAAKAIAAHEAVERADLQRLQYLLHLNHELRNPLTAIVTSIDLLGKEYAKASAQEATLNAEQKARVGYHIRTIGTTSHHVMSMLNDVLDMERLEEEGEVTTSEPFSVRQLIQDVAEIYTITAIAAGNTLSTRVAGGLYDSWIGPTSRIRQVLLNLVSNAIKHAPKSAIVVSVSQSPEGLVFEVSDNGPGLSEHARAHLFEPFASSLGAKGSTGLGLRICKLIVERQLRGTIELREADGQGVAFVVAIPLQMGAPETPKWEYVAPMASSRIETKADPDPSQTIEALSGKSLLLVDDDADNLEVMTMALEDVGMKVQTAQTAQQALDLIKQGSFDVTLLDYNLGAKSEFDGIQLASRIVGGTAGAIVGYTGNMSANLDAKWKDVGVKLIVRKPASVKTLTATLLEATTAE